MHSLYIIETPAPNEWKIAIQTAGIGQIDKIPPDSIIIRNSYLKNEKGMI